MEKLIIEVLTLVDFYYDDNDIARDYTYNEYLVKRASDNYPIAQFKTMYEAEQFIKDNCEEEE